MAVSMPMRLRRPQGNEFAAGTLEAEQIIKSTLVRGGESFKGDQFVLRNLMAARVIVVPMPLDLSKAPEVELKINTGENQASWLKDEAGWLLVDGDEAIFVCKPIVERVISGRTFKYQLICVSVTGAVRDGGDRQRGSMIPTVWSEVPLLLQSVRASRTSPLERTLTLALKKYFSKVERSAAEDGKMVIGGVRPAGMGHSLGSYSYHLDMTNDTDFCENIARLAQSIGQAERQIAPSSARARALHKEEADRFLRDVHGRPGADVIHGIVDEDDKPWHFPSPAIAITKGYGTSPHVESGMAHGVLECIMIPGGQQLASHVSQINPLAFAIYAAGIVLDIGASAGVGARLGREAPDSLRRARVT